jgi:DNA-binding transcriptional ArsR family regulator
MPATVSAPHGATTANSLSPRKGSAPTAPTRRAFAEAAHRLDAISDPVRLQILWWLGQHEQSVTDLCARVGMRQQALTYHLIIMKHEQLVVYRREGRFNVYGLTDGGRKAMAAAMRLIAQDRCAG